MAKAKRVVEIDTDTHKALKLLAVHKGVTMKAIVRELVQKSTARKPLADS